MLSTETIKYVQPLIETDSDLFDRIACEFQNDPRYREIDSAINDPKIIDFLGKMFEQLSSNNSEFEQSPYQLPAFTGEELLNAAINRDFKSSDFIDEHMQGIVGFDAGYYYQEFIHADSPDWEEGCQHKFLMAVRLGNAGFLVRSSFDSDSEWTHLADTDQILDYLKIKLAERLILPIIYSTSLD